MVDYEGGLAVVEGVGVGCGDDPGWGVRYPEVEDLALFDEDVKRVHDLADRGGVIPPVDVEDVDVVSLEFLERLMDAHEERFLGVAQVVGAFALADGVGAVVGCVLCGEDDLVPVVAGGHPLADPGFGFFVLVVVGCVDEVAAEGGEGVEEGEGGVFGHGAHDGGPG